MTAEKTKTKMFLTCGLPQYKKLFNTFPDVVAFFMTFEYWTVPNEAETGIDIRGQWALDSIVDSSTHEKPINLKIRLDFILGSKELKNIQEEIYYADKSDLEQTFEADNIKEIRLW